MVLNGPSSWAYGVPRKKWFKKFAIAWNIYSVTVKSPITFQLNTWNIYVKYVIIAEKKYQFGLDVNVYRLQKSLLWKKS